MALAVIVKRPVASAGGSNTEGDEKLACDCAAAPALAAVMTRRPSFNGCVRIESRIGMHRMFKRSEACLISNS